MKRVHRLDLTGQRFDRWKVVEKAETRGASGEVYWRCVCDCGTTKEVVANSLRLGLSKSCGCFSADRSRKHGMEGTLTYNAWAAMRMRCENKNATYYARYGGRGITVCDRWKSFKAFLADMGEKPPGKSSLDRIDNEGGYEPGNCRWATTKQQIRNRHSSPRFMWKGETRSLADIAEEVGAVPWRKAYERIRRGWSVEDAVTIKRANRWHRTDYTPRRRAT